MTNLNLSMGMHPMQEAFLLGLKETNPRACAARVAFSSHEHYRLWFPHTAEERLGRVRGAFYHNGGDLPVVGDWVAVELLEGDHEFLPILEVLPRVTTLRRREVSGAEQTLVANVDWVCLVTSHNQDFSGRRLDRGVAMAVESGARAMIVLNKCDLADANSPLLTDTRARFPDVPVISCSAETGAGIHELTQTFSEGNTVTFLGMSGVGKSSLLNRLCMDTQTKMETRAIRHEDSRGRHTTTHRQMFRADGGFWVIDTPGIREFFGTSGTESLEDSFSVIASLTSRCRFRDCRHETEPDCAVIGALSDGTLSEDQWRNFLKMRREIEFQENKNNKAYHSAKKKQWAKVAVQVRGRLKEKGRK